MLKQEIERFLADFEYKQDQGQTFTEEDLKKMFLISLLNEKDEE